jgi:hypothetical protein
MPLPAPHRSRMPPLHRSKRRRATRRAQPIRRLRRPTTRPTAHQARRPTRERIHATDEPNSPPKQDPNARTVSAARGTKRPTPASTAATCASSTRLPDAQVSVWPGTAAATSAPRAHPATERAQVADGVRVAAAFGISDPALTTPNAPAVVARKHMGTEPEVSDSVARARFSRFSFLCFSFIVCFYTPHSVDLLQ